MKSETPKYSDTNPKPGLLLIHLFTRTIAAEDKSELFWTFVSLDLLLTEFDFPSVFCFSDMDICCKRKNFVQF